MVLLNNNIISKCLAQPVRVSINKTLSMSTKSSNMEIKSSMVEAQEQLQEIPIQHMPTTLSTGLDSVQEELLLELAIVVVNVKAA